MSDEKVVWEQKFGWNMAAAFSKIEWHCSCASKTTGVMLTTLCPAFHVKRAVDIGIANGFTTHCLAYGLAAANVPGATLFSFDISEYSCKLAKRQTADIPINHVILQKNTKEINLKEICGDEPIDLCYIDGDHSYEMAKNDIEKCLEVSHHKTIFLIHDYNVGLPEVMHAVRDTLKEPEWGRFVIYEQGSTGDIQTVMCQRRLYENG